MFKNLLAIAVISFLATIGTASGKTLLPYEGHEPLLNLDSVYSADRAAVSLSQDDITFTSKKTPASKLTAAEIYIVAGAKSSNLSTREALSPWADDVFTAVAAYYAEHETIPAVLDESALRSIPRYERWLDSALDVYRNPLTGEWPRLNAKQPSPGDVYIRVLTPAEKMLYARKLGRWSVWFGKGDSEHLCSEVFYQRIYGWNGPIYESLPHLTCNGK